MIIAPYEGPPFATATGGDARPGKLIIQVPRHVEDPDISEEEFEARVVDYARRLLDDIPVCKDAHYSVKRINGAPLLVLAFDLPETIHQPACGVRLVTSQREGDPMQGGKPLSGDKLRRHVRDSVEHYLAKHGVRIPAFEGEG
jgi:hypothetical protein